MLRSVAEKTAKTADVDGATASTRPLPEPETALELLETMALIRRFEEEAGRQYQRAKAGGFLHLAIGEEATIVGTTSVMQPDDYLIGTYRTHGHAIARGTDPKHVMAELFGRVDGTSGGRGGSMHIFDGERRFMGGYGIVGGNLPLAAGLGARLRLQGHRRGHRLHVRRRRLQHRQLRRDDEPGGALEAAGRLPGREQPLRDGHVDRAPLRGHRPLAEGRGPRRPRRAGRRHGRARGARDASPSTSAIAREERRPTLVEAFTYRYRGHSAADPEVYRTKEEVEEWRKKDPIEIFARPARGRGRDLRGRARGDARAGRGAGGRRRSSSPTPRPSRRSTSLYDHLYVVGDQVPGWYAVDERAPQPLRGEREGEELTGEATRAGRGGRRLRRAGGRGLRAQAGRGARGPGGRRRPRGSRGVRRRGRRGRDPGTVVS